MSHTYWKRTGSLLVAAALALAGCQGEKGGQGDIGPIGPTGPAAPTTGTITGTVTDGVLQTGLAGVTVTVKTTGGAQLGTATTDANGAYSVTAMPVGVVAVGFSKQYFTSPGDLLVGVLAGSSVTANASMSEGASGKPAVSLASASTDVGYGQQVTVTATATDPNGDPLTYAWSNATSPSTLGSVSGSGNTATVTLPSMTDAFASRLESTTAPASQYISGYRLDDRFGIIPILPDTRGEMSVKVTVSDGRGQSTSASVTIDAASVLTSARNVAIGTRVYVNAGHDGTMAWTLAGPTGSTAALDDTTSRTPSFVADVAGTYSVTEAANTMTIFAGNWKGVVTGGSGNTIVYDPTCGECHNGTLAPNNFTPWAASPHATMMTRGINGGNGTSYGASCLVCHTVGNDRGVVNNGFDDVAAAKGWTFPTSYQATNWTNMVTNYPDVARLANIQCENCHGPQTGVTGSQSQTAHSQTGTTGPWKSPRIGYSAELCATCHASGTGHHNYSEWSTVDSHGWGHSNRGGPRNEGVSASTGKLNAHCGRCHTAQGFNVYAGQVAAGNPANIVSTSTVLTDVTLANVEPVTCQACHDPHDASNPSQLRTVSPTFGDTAKLAAGFQMYGVGKGALCMTCHNSRNGTYSGGTYLHEDGAMNPTGYSAPHQACQTDVFAGRNAYFLGTSTPMTSKHAAIEDTCVGCHMVLNPETHLSHGSPVTSTHVFRVTDDNRATLCANCHSSTVNGEGIAGGVEAGLANLGTAISNAVKVKMNGAGAVTVVAYNSATDLYSSATAIPTATNAVTAASIEEIHGQIGFNLTFATPVTVQWVDSAGNPVGSPVGVTSFGVQLGSIKDGAATPAPLFALSGNLVRAGWNYFLIEGDQSKGLHNPTFANTVLNATVAKDLSY